ncbi:MAG: CBS domain-containing protein [Lachnospiraceae bacterium]|nr:CBS domain-containing protein [Lachnospiraceae bacterium]
MVNNVEQLTIRENITIKDAMEKIDSNGCKTVFVVKEDRLIGCLTDGDIRRYLIKGGNIENDISNVVNYQPKYFKVGEKIDYQKYMVVNMITAVPIVDEEGKLVEVKILSESSSIYRKIDNETPVVIMAGGLGTRLKPYTDIIPKPLIPIGEKTITEHILDRFVVFGCTNFNMILNYKKSLIEAYFNDIGKYNNLSYVEEKFFMGTAGGISLLKNELKENFFVVNCDIVVDYDYYELWKEHIEKKNIVTMIVAKKNIQIPYGTVVSDAKGNVSSLVEKPQMTYFINTGMYICNCKIFDYMSENEKIDMPDLIQRCIDAGEKVGQKVIGENDWSDMGQVHELTRMKLKFE